MANIEEIEINDPDYYMTEPKRQVTCTLAAEAEYAALTAALETEGVDSGDVKVLHGEAGANIMDMTGEGLGVIESLRRLFPMINNVIIGHMAKAETVLNEGGYAVAIPAHEEEEARRVAQIMADSGAANIVYFGKRRLWRYE